MQCKTAHDVYSLPRFGTNKHLDLQQPNRTQNVPQGPILSPPQSFDQVQTAQKYGKTLISHLFQQLSYQQHSSHYSGRPYPYPKLFSQQYNNPHPGQHPVNHSQFPSQSLTSNPRLPPLFNCNIPPPSNIQSNRMNSNVPPNCLPCKDLPLPNSSRDSSQQRSSMWPNQQTLHCKRNKVQQHTNVNKADMRYKVMQPPPSRIFPHQQLSYQQHSSHYSGRPYPYPKLFSQQYNNPHPGQHPVNHSQFPSQSLTSNPRLPPLFNCNIPPPSNIQSNRMNSNVPPNCLPCKDLPLPNSSRDSSQQRSSMWPNQQTLHCKRNKVQQHTNVNKADMRYKVMQPPPSRIFPHQQLSYQQHSSHYSGRPYPYPKLFSQQYNNPHPGQHPVNHSQFPSQSLTSNPRLPPLFNCNIPPPSNIQSNRMNSNVPPNCLPCKDLPLPNSSRDSSQQRSSMWPNQQTLHCKRNKVQDEYSSVALQQNHTNIGAKITQTSLSVNTPQDINGQKSSSFPGVDSNSGRQNVLNEMGMAASVYVRELQNELRPKRSTGYLLPKEKSQSCKEFSESCPNTFSSKNSSKRDRVFPAVNSSWREENRSKRFCEDCPPPTVMPGSSAKIMASPLPFTLTPPLTPPDVINLKLVDSSSDAVTKEHCKTHEKLETFDTLSYGEPVLSKPSEKSGSVKLFTSHSAKSFKISPSGLRIQEILKQENDLSFSDHESATAKPLVQNDSNKPCTELSNVSVASSQSHTEEDSVDNSIPPISLLEDYCSLKFTTVNNAELSFSNKGQATAKSLLQYNSDKSCTEPNDINVASSQSHNELDTADNSLSSMSLEKPCPLGFNTVNDAKSPKKSGLVLPTKNVIPSELRGSCIDCELITPKPPVTVVDTSSQSHNELDTADNSLSSMSLEKPCPLEFTIVNDAKSPKKSGLALPTKNFIPPEMKTSCIDCELITSKPPVTVVNTSSQSHNELGTADNSLSSMSLEKPFPLEYTTVNDAKSPKISGLALPTKNVILSEMKTSCIDCELITPKPPVTVVNTSSQSHNELDTADNSLSSLSLEKPCPLEFTTVNDAKSPKKSSLTLPTKNVITSSSCIDCELITPKPLVTVVDESSKDDAQVMLVLDGNFAPCLSDGAPLHKNKEVDSSSKNPSVSRDTVQGVSDFTMASTGEMNKNLETDVNWDVEILYTSSNAQETSVITAYTSSLDKSSQPKYNANMKTKTISAHNTLIKNCKQLQETQTCENTSKLLLPTSQPCVIPEPLTQIPFFEGWNAKVNVPNLNVYCYLCKTDVKGNDVTRHLLFTNLKCTNCSSVLSSCRDLEGMTREKWTCSKPKLQFHNYCEWKTSPVDFLLYRMWKDYRKKRLINDKPIIIFPKYIRSLSCLKNVVPWSTAYEKCKKFAEVLINNKCGVVEGNGESSQCRSDLDESLPLSKEKMPVNKSLKNAVTDRVSGNVGKLGKNISRKSERFMDIMINAVERITHTPKDLKKSASSVSHEEKSCWAMSTDLQICRTESFGKTNPLNTDKEPSAPPVTLDALTSTSLQANIRSSDKDVAILACNQNDLNKEREIHNYNSQILCLEEGSTAFDQDILVNGEEEMIMDSTNQNWVSGSPSLYNLLDKVAEYVVVDNTNTYHDKETSNGETNFATHTLIDLSESIESDIVNEISVDELEEENVLDRYSEERKKLTSSDNAENDEYTLNISIGSTKEKIPEECPMCYERLCPLLFKVHIPTLTPSIQCPGCDLLIRNVTKELYIVIMKFGFTDWLYD
ncbi:hypothetical protein SK128_007362 [Halocaridina rubra]|uniref:Uncharacterized protein n=1 Tax=Halocaridina rubra TaxID=373956 RepID=A0AAN9A622_HALRR